MLTVFNADAQAVSDKVAAFFAAHLVLNNNILAVLNLLERNSTADFADDSKGLGLTSLEELFNSGKTLCNIGL